MDDALDMVNTAFALMAIGGISTALFLFVPLWGPQVVFRELLPPQLENANVRFSLLDGMYLILFLAILNALFSKLPDEMGGVAGIVLAVATNVLVVLIWVKCLRFLAEYGIVQRRAKLLVMLILYPLSIFVIAEIALGLMILVSCLEVIVRNGEISIYRYFAEPITQVAIFIFAFFCLMYRVVRHLFKRFVVPGMEVESNVEAIDFKTPRDTTN